LPPIHIYRAPFNIGDDDDLTEERFAPEIWSEIKRIAEEKKEKFLKALDTGVDDNRSPLEAAS
jgi:hypothetical protein